MAYASGVSPPEGGGAQPYFWAPEIGACENSSESPAEHVAPGDRWMLRVADRIDAAAKCLPGGARLKQHDCLTAAVYLEAARHNLLIASASLRMTATWPEGGNDVGELDPRLSEWLH